ncbi:ABC transporter ATP-binding protein [Sphingomonas sp. ASY06-1R]|uniref:ABC transporter ATP-binding protein n=1 Tax=Sphingomonas sp. ASY06-1R TaxID=3445771 RepID=UPI003FA22106
MVRLDQVSVTLGGHRVVDNVSADLGGGVIGLIGPNGAGKSTLIRAIAGLIAHQGRITIEGAGAAATPRERARRIAYLPQGQTIHWPLTVERLVALGRLPHLAPFARPGAADMAAIEAALDRTDLAMLRDRPINQLSGGERARALLARALAVAAPLLLADEPLAALDPSHQIEVMGLLRGEAERGATVIAVLHDLTIAARWCDRLLILNHGRLVADGAPTAVLSAERIAAVYGVTAHIGQSGGAPVVVPLTRVAVAPAGARETPRG